MHKIFFSICPGDQNGNSLKTWPSVGEHLTLNTSLEREFVWLAGAY